MSTDVNLQFITDKINEVRSAIMYSLSDDLIRLPNSIVTAVKVDEAGQLWFVCDRPAYMLEHIPTSFPVRLHFYRKGKLFHMEISGAARISNEIATDNGDHDRRLLIQMDMKNITYKETDAGPKNNILLHFNKGWQWLLKHTGLNVHGKPILHSMSGNHS